MECPDYPRCASSNTAIAGWLAALSEESGINPKTVAKWQKGQTVEDQHLILRSLIQRA